MQKHSISARFWRGRGWRIQRTNRTSRGAAPGMRPIRPGQPAGLDRPPAEPDRDQPDHEFGRYRYLDIPYRLQVPIDQPYEPLLPPISLPCCSYAKPVHASTEAGADEAQLKILDILQTPAMGALDDAQVAIELQIFDKICKAHQVEQRLEDFGPVLLISQFS